MSKTGKAPGVHASIPTHQQVHATPLGDCGPEDPTIVIPDFWPEAYSKIKTLQNMDSVHIDEPTMRLDVPPFPPPPEAAFVPSMTEKKALEKTSPERGSSQKVGSDGEGHEH